MTDNNIPDGAEVIVIDNLESRAFAALRQYRLRDEEGFAALLGDESDREQVPVLMAVVGLLDAWLAEHAGDLWIDEQIGAFFDRRREA